MPTSRKRSASRRGKLGVPAAKLGDEDLERELRHLWRTREETIVHGGSHAIRAHTDRMLELEHEYIARFPRETQPTPSRTRRGARLSALQPVTRNPLGATRRIQTSSKRQPG